eukprot:1076643-Prorocentrum_minimum.AAC.1
MSVIVRDPDGKLLLLCKGADDVRTHESFPYGRVVSESPHAEQLGSLGNPAAKTLKPFKKTLTSVPAQP